MRGEREEEREGEGEEEGEEKEGRRDGGGRQEREGNISNKDAVSSLILQAGLWAPAGLEVLGRCSGLLSPPSQV